MTSLGSYNLRGRQALITGAAGLLGPQHAAALAELGAEVVLSDIDPRRLAEAAVAVAELQAGTYRTVVMDVTNPDSIRDTAHRVGRVDVLVNNAAIDPKVLPGDRSTLASRFENFQLEEWNRQIDVGLTGAFLCCQVFGAAMAARGHGVVINIASDLSVIAPDQRLYRIEGVADGSQPVKPVSYSVIKTGLIGLTRYLAAYWASMGVRVNAISPAGVLTNQSPEFVSRLTKLIPVGRMADVDEYRAAIQFLASPASAYMTGQNLVIDGGRTIL
jgi:NAD(P)-dependent dehydrogenase (short-subunit alcohol dehydrogenase family)